MRRPARLYAAKEHTPEEIAGMREVCKVSTRFRFLIRPQQRMRADHARSTYFLSWPARCSTSPPLPSDRESPPTRLTLSYTPSA